MRRYLGFLALSLLILAATLSLAACGSSPSVTTAAPPSSSASTPIPGTSTPGAPSTTLPVASGSITTTPETAPGSVAQTGQVGSKGNPIPVGKEASVGVWDIKVVSADLQADAAVKDAPGYQAPDSGSQYVLVNVEALNEGASPDSFGNALGYQIVGGKEGTFDATDLGLAKSIENSDAVSKGGTVSGPLVFAVPSDQIDGATLWVAPSSAQQETGVYFALK